MKIRRNIAGFLLWKFGNKSHVLAKHRQGPNLKAHSFRALKANASILFLFANDQKLRFYQNKGLSHDSRCGVSNTFPTRNQILNQKSRFFIIQLD